MELRPEQEAVLEYARRKGTEATVASIRERLAGTFEELDALVAGVPAEVAARRPAAGGWSVREVVDHLVVTHRRALEELRSLLAGREPEGGPIPASLQSGAPLARPWQELREDLERTHSAFSAAVRGANDDTPTTARAPVVMVVRCATPDGGSEPVQWIQSFDWKAYAVLFRGHTLEHRNQIRRILAGFGAGAA